MKTKITMDQRGLKSALAVLATVVNPKTSLPILGDVMLSYDGERKAFALTCSDTEKWLTIDCGQGDEAIVHLIEDDSRDAFRAVCIGFKELREAIALLPSDKLLEVELDGATHLMKVDYQIGRFEMPWEEAAEFPVSPAVIGKGQKGAVLSAELSPAQLLPWIKQARSCVGSDELRPIRNSVCLDANIDGITIVSTDGHSLYRKELSMGAGWLTYATFDLQKSAPVVVPKYVLQALDMAFAGKERMTMTVDAQRVEWKADGVTLICRQQEGHYPNYNSVIPQNNSHTAAVDARSLAGALRRLSLFASDSSNMGKIVRNGDSLTVEAEDLDFSRKGAERVRLTNAGDCTLPEGIAIGFKIAKMVELLGLVSTEVAELHIESPDRTIVIKEETANQDMTLLVMPMMVNG